MGLPPRPPGGFFLLGNGERRDEHWYNCEGVLPEGLQDRDLPRADSVIGAPGDASLSPLAPGRCLPPHRYAEVLLFGAKVKQCVNNSGGDFLPLLGGSSIFVSFTDVHVGHEMRCIESSESFFGHHQHSPYEGGGIGHFLVALGRISSKPHRCEGTLDNVCRAFTQYQSTTQLSNGHQQQWAWRCQRGNRSNAKPPSENPT